MNVSTVVEIIPGIDKRWRFCIEDSQFKVIDFQHIHNSLRGIYGWVVGYGEPPMKHKDIMYITNKSFNFGDVVESKIVGVFVNCTGDHKLVSIDTDRNENDLHELPTQERDMLKSIYSGKYEGDEWAGYEKAIEILKAK